MRQNEPTKKQLGGPLLARIDNPILVVSNDSTQKRIIANLRSADLGCDNEVISGLCGFEAKAWFLGIRNDNVRSTTLNMRAGKGPVDS